MKASKKIDISIDISTISTHDQMVNHLSAAFGAKPGDTVCISIDMKRLFWMYSDLLLMIVGVVTFLRGQGIEVNGAFVGLQAESNMVKYASRMNFFRLLNFDFHEPFQRQPSSGKFTEISIFNGDNINDLHKDIMKVLINQGVDQSFTGVLESCLWEVMDNTLNHSHPSFEYGYGSGLLCCQYFPIKKKVRIMISDNGQGIHAAMKRPGSKHSDISEPVAVSRSIEKGFTNGGGKGFGLWATSEMVRQNKGRLIIHSGNSQLICSNSTQLTSTGFWRGTFTFLELNTNFPVDHTAIWGANSDRAQLHSEFRESVLAGLATIW